MLKTSWKVDCLGLSDTGRVRGSNEDAWSALPSSGIFIVADGMGGHLAGEIAARAAVNLLPDHLPCSDYSLDHIRSAIKIVNANIYQKGQANANLSGMGTTLCCLILNAEGLIAHVGDSRVYRFRNQHLEQLTQDHSLVNELLEDGGLCEDEAESFPYKHILTKAVGTHACIEPTCIKVEVQEGDLFILCTDGLTNLVRNKEINELCKQHFSLEEIAGQLIALANERGGTDNVTVLLVRLLEK